MFARSDLSLKSLLSGNIKLKSQTGLSEQFIVAAKRAQQYLPYMEEIFRGQGLPTKITRLPFVESMFNLYALSKVGAAGVWQIMPDTARGILTMNELVDERYSPIKATKAAAILLRENFDSLKSWPLAITAYNHGKNGMANAVHKLKTTNLGSIIRRYESPSFQHASKNFYAEFIAASNVYDLLINKGVITNHKNLPRLRPLIIGRSSLNDIFRYTFVKKEILEKYNPCLKPHTYDLYRNSKLPSSYEIFLPSSIAQAMEKQIARPSLGQSSDFKSLKSEF